MNRMRAAQGLDRDLRESEVANFARLDELLHCADRLFDRHRRIAPVQVVEIDRVDTEPLERLVRNALRIFRRTVDAPRRVADRETKLGCDHRLVTPAAQRAPDQPLVGMRPVDFGGVEKVDAQRQGTVNGGDGFVFVGGTVGEGHAHAAEPEFRDERDLECRACAFPS